MSDGAENNLKLSLPATGSLAALVVVKARTLRLRAPTIIVMMPTRTARDGQCQGKNDAVTLPCRTTAVLSVNNFRSDPSSFGPLNYDRGLSEGTRVPFLTQGPDSRNGS